MGWSRRKIYRRHVETLWDLPWQYKLCSPLTNAFKEKNQAKYWSMQQSLSLYCRLACAVARQRQPLGQLTNQKAFMDFGRAGAWVACEKELTYYW